MILFKSRLKSLEASYLYREETLRIYIENFRKENIRLVEENGKLRVENNKLRVENNKLRNENKSQGDRHAVMLTLRGQIEHFSFHICLYYHDHPGAKLSISPHPSKKFADFLPKVMAFREKSVTLQRVLRTKCAEN